jgi:hypothetical protein
MRAAVGVLTAVSALMLAGCAQPDAGGSAVDGRPLQKPKVLSIDRGLPAGLSADGRRARPVAAILGPGRVALATWGSSTCPYAPVRMMATGPDALRVVLDLPGSKHMVCTADLGPTTVRLGVDPAMTRDGNVDLVLAFRHEPGDSRVVARPLSDQG